MNFYKSVFIVAIIAICTPTTIDAAMTMNASPTPDFYSGRDDLKTIALGRSAFTDNDRGDNISVNIYQKTTDGSYVVLVREHKIINGRTRTITSNSYIKAWVDSSNRICFNWKGKQYHTPPQTIRR